MEEQQKDNQGIFLVNEQNKYFFISLAKPDK